MWIVVSGNPIDGFSFHGPFDDNEKANEWAEYNLSHVEYWVTRLNAVE